MRTIKGFTLIELMIALTVFAIGLLSIAGMQVKALEVNSRASSLTVATALAEGILEEILALDTGSAFLQTAEVVDPNLLNEVLYILCIGRVAARVQRQTRAVGSALLIRKPNVVLDTIAYAE